MNANVFSLWLLAIVLNLTVAQAQQQPTIDSLLKDLPSSDKEVVINAVLRLAKMREPVVPRMFAFIKAEKRRGEGAL